MSNESMTLPADSNGVETIDLSMLPDGNITETNAADAKSAFRLIDRKAIKVDWNRNPRDVKKAYTKEKITWLARSIFDNGLLEPITVSKRADGSLWLLKGHLRLSAINIAVVDGLPLVKADKDGKGARPAVPASPDFMSKIKAIVIEGLSLTDELDLLMDHGDVTLLSRQEKFNAVRTMVQAGFTQEKIASKMRESRGAVQPLINLARMPQTAIDLFQTTGKDAIELTNDSIGKLYKAYREDVDNGGCRPKTAGPLFSAELESIVKAGNAGRDKAIPRKTLLTMRESHDDSDIQDLLTAIANNSTEDAAAAINRLKLRLVPVGEIAPRGDLVGSGYTVTEGNVDSE